MVDPACESCGGPTQNGACPKCATHVQTASASSAPRPADDGVSAPPEIPGYRIVGRLGEGGMGTVYLAEETALGRRVAIKVISRRVAADAQSKARFLREARTMATIEHPHVVRVYAFGEAEGYPYLAMEYVEGETLSDRIARLGKLPADDAIRITRDIADALEAAWDKGVIHRDIKPSNILIDRRNRVRVADFGLAKPIHLESDVSLTQTGYMLGTPHYISPEQAQGRDADFRSDFYSLGVMLFHMLTGARPFDGTTPIAIVAKHLNDPLPSLRTRGANVPAEVEKLTRWMSEKDPLRRPESHQKLLSAIDSLLVRTPSAPMRSFSTIPISDIRSSRWRPIAAIAIIALVAVSSWFFFFRRKQPPLTFAPETKFVIAIAPFYGPDDDSAKEGRVMAALVERAVMERLGTDARVLGIEETKSPVRNHAEARALGTRLGATAVIWGEAFALRTETEIRPNITVISAARGEERSTRKDGTADARLLAANRVEIPESLGDSGGTLKLQSEAPNQIELRKTSASGMGDVVVVLAGIHALKNERDPAKALAFFRQAPQTAETLRYQVQALLASNQTDEARNVLVEALALDPAHAPSHALFGDLLMSAERVPEAVAAYQRAAAIGQPYTSGRGIAYDGRIYLKETYRSEAYTQDKETETLYLLAMDPVSLRIVDRQALPGIAQSFRIEGDTLVIGYKTFKDDLGASDELRLRQGRFDRVLWPPPNLLWRMRTMKAGRVLPANFTGEIDRVRWMGQSGGRFARRPVPSATVPARLPDLERALREAAERDPTQPWHLFWLAMAIRHQNRIAEADRVFDELVRREYPGVPYFEYSWMLHVLERLREYRWSDRLYPKTLAARQRHPQPVTSSMLIEWLINASFVRQAAMNRDIDRGYIALTRARAMAGPSPEGSDLVAAAWAEHFEAKGNANAARLEREHVRRMSGHPFNYLGAGAKVDYALTTGVAALITFIVLYLGIAARAWIAAGRGRRDHPHLLARIGGLWERTPRLGQLIAAVVIGTAVVLGAIYAFLDGMETVLGVILVIAFVAGVLRLIRSSPVEVAAAVRPREKRALVAAYALIVIAGIFIIDRLGVVGALNQLPFGLTDAIGHPRVLADLDDALKDDRRREARYVLAIANHYGGKRNRAEDLYRGIEDYPGARKNFEALRAGGMPVRPLTAEEIAAAMMGTRMQRWRGAFDISPVIIPLLWISLASGLILLLPFLLVRARESEEPPPPSRTFTVAALLIPAIYDIRRGATWRALVMLFLIGLAVLPLATLSSSERPAVGPLTALSLPSLDVAFPLPQPLDGLRMTLIMAYPYAKIFFGIVILSLAGALALHLMRVPRMLRERREAAAAPEASFTASAADGAS